MAFRTRDLFIRQKTQTINALRGHLAEYGVIAPAGVAHLGRLVAVMQRADSGLPTEVIELARMLVDQIDELQLRIDTLVRDIRKRAREDDVASRLMTIPGVGPICASAMIALAPPAESFARGRDFSAWLGVRSVSRTDRVPARTAKAAFIRRQGTVGANLEDGPTRFAPVAHHRCDGGGQMGGVARGPGGPPVQDPGWRR